VWSKKKELKRTPPDWKRKEGAPSLRGEERELFEEEKRRVKKRGKSRPTETT